MYLKYKVSFNKAYNFLIGISLAIFCMFYIGIHEYEELILVVLNVLIISFIIINKIRIKINKTQVLILIYLLICIISLAVSVDFLASIKGLLKLFSILLIVFFLAQFDSWKLVYLKGFLVLGLIHVVATISQFFFPNIVSAITVLLLSPEGYIVSQSLLRVGAYAGVTDQVGINGFYIALVALYWFQVYRENKKISYLFLNLIILFALVLTGKRSMLIAVFIGYLLIIIQQKNNFINIKYFMYSSFFVLFLIFLFLKVPEANHLFIRVLGLNTSDYSSNRFVMWKIILDFSLKKPLLGYGYWTSGSVLGFTPHNAFLQILLEIGIIGLVLFCIILFKIGFVTYKNYKESILVEVKYYSFSVFVCFLIWCFTGNPVIDTYPFLMLLLITDLLKPKKRYPVLQSNQY